MSSFNLKRRPQKVHKTSRRHRGSQHREKSKTQSPAEPLHGITKDEVTFIGSPNQFDCATDRHLTWTRI
jgi:hypothetical protein